MNTGFLATPHLLAVLADYGYTDVAFKVLEQENSPGWLYNVKCGATTMLENWDGFATCEGSFNHYSYGAVCHFLFAYVAGIKPQIGTPGYKHFMIEPICGRTLTYARASYDSIYGKIYSQWEKNGDTILITVSKVFLQVMLACKWR